VNARTEHGRKSSHCETTQSLARDDPCNEAGRLGLSNKLVEIGKPRGAMFWNSHRYAIDSVAIVQHTRIGQFGRKVEKATRGGLCRGPRLTRY